VALPAVGGGLPAGPDGDALRRTFSVAAPFLRDAAAGAGEVNFSDRGLQLTRQFRAFKLWLSLKVFGAKWSSLDVRACMATVRGGDRG
jgi:glutamate/tyrosine decarboxylase-like PLP-dependent enzyme